MTSSELICLIPRDLAPDVARELEQRFGDGVRIVRERRGAERRRALRRESEVPPVPLADRRRVRNDDGRRVADRRGELVPLPAKELRAGAESLAEVSFAAVHPLDGHELAMAESLRHVVRFQLGERQAFRELYEHNFDGVYGYLLTALRDRHEAEDAAQEVFLRALRALPRYEFRGVPFEAWLFRIVRNYTISHKRREQPVSVADPADLERWRERRELREGIGQGAALESDEGLMTLVDCLPDPQRQVMVLRYMVGLEWSAIADVLERSNGAVRALEQRALKFLRVRLKALGEGGSDRTRSLPMRRLPAVDPVTSRRRQALLQGLAA